MTEKNAWVMANSLFTVLLVCEGKPTVKAVGTVADVVGFLGWRLRYYALMIMLLCIMNCALCINNYAL